MRKIVKIRWVPFFFLVILFLMITGIFTGLTATNSVANSSAGILGKGVTAEELKPPECDVITVTDLVVLSNGDTPSAASELILGTPGQDIVNGGGGDDCIVGGGGDDRICTATGFFGWLLCWLAPDTYLDGLRGGAGTDVIIGNDGNDALFGDGGNDICYGGAGSNHINCETSN